MCCEFTNIGRDRDANEDVNIRDKSTSQVYHQASWLRYSRKQLPYIQIYHSSTHHSNPQA
jgi:hypothetical protein